ncbi:MAG TPA: tetratricopeptide repeat protein [Acidobacteriota bacterium]|nr:tetratricopeptide repeat protein [Acidobacteriota bacterium]
MGSPSKDKSLKTAEKFVLQGKFASAVNEYLKILKTDHDDVILLNTVGDLLVRLNKNTDAVNYFQRVSDVYLSNGFFLKAIATLKKILSLNADNPRVREALANLYHKQGLYHDACIHYKEVGQKLFETGKEREAVEVFRKIVEFEKNDVEVLERLGNLEAAQGDKLAAANFLKLAGAASLKQRKPEHALELLQRSLELNPRDTELIDVFVPAAHAAGKDELARKVLENLLTLRPGDLHLEQLRARNLIHLGKSLEAEDLLLNLYRQHGREASGLLELLNGYLEKQNPDRFCALAEKLSNTLVSPDELRAFAEILQRATVQMPNNMTLLEILAQLYGRTNDLAAAAGVQSDLVSRYVLRGDLRKAFAAADELVHWDPRNPEYLRQHRALFEKAYPGKVYEEPTIEPEPAAAGVEGFDFNEISAEDLEHIQMAVVGAEPAPEPTPIPAKEETPFEISMDEVSTEGTDKGWEALLSEVSDEPVDMETSLEIKPEDLLVEKAAEPPVERVSFENLGQLATTEIAPTRPDDLAEALQEVDFYLKMGFQDDARLLLEKLRATHPESTEVQEHIKELAGSTVFQQEKSARAISELEPVPDQELKDLSLQIDEAIDSLFDFELSLDEKTEESLEYKAGQPQVAQSPPPKGHDFQTHLDLGKAYREMGLLSDAIQEFQQAIGQADNGAPQRDTALCYSLLANCYLENGESIKAALWAQKGLELADIKDYEKKALLYDLGRALEAQGKKQEALQFYGKIHEVTPNFRDVSQRIKQLAS